jgi:hypothetical protein
MPKPTTLTFLLVVLAPLAAAAGHRLECPAVAPADWGAPQGKLSGVAVLAAKDGEPIDETAPPSLVPDGESLRAGTLHQRWRMNGYGAGWRFYVDCRYQGSARVLRLDAGAVKSCDRFISKFSRTSGESGQSENSLACD